MVKSGQNPEAHVKFGKNTCPKGHRLQKILLFGPGFDLKFALQIDEHDPFLYKKFGL
jgi:hypothetical protein